MQVSGSLPERLDQGQDEEWEPAGGERAHDDTLVALRSLDDAIRFNLDFLNNLKRLLHKLLPFVFDGINGFRDGARSSFKSFRSLFDAAMSRLWLVTLIWSSFDGGLRSARSAGGARKSLLFLRSFARAALLGWTPAVALLSVSAILEDTM